MTEILNLFKSLDMNHRDDDETIVALLIDKGIAPINVRYGVMNSTYRGAAQTDTGELYYFSYIPMTANFKLVKADNSDKIWEAKKILSKCLLGCDLIQKADSEDEEPEEEVEDQEEQKAQTGALPTAAVNTVPEEQNIRDQQRLTTEVHPGAAGSTTPDQNHDKWHPPDQHSTAKSWDYGALLKGLGQNLQKSAIQTRPYIAPKEAQYMVEHLGMSPQDIEAGREMNPMQRARYNAWLTKSLNDRVGSLKKWIAKH